MFPRNDMKPADVATLLNAFMGLGAIGYASVGEMATAWHLIFAAIIVDGIDGALARIGLGGSPLGKHLDMLADTVTFVAAPAALLIMAPSAGLASFIAAVLLLFAGLTRLARFANQEDAASFFHGLSTPGSTLFVGAAALLVAREDVVAIVAALSALAMVAQFRLPKLRGAIGVTGVVIILANFALFFAGHPWARYGLMAQTAFAAVYLAFGSLYVRQRSAGTPA